MRYVISSLFVFTTFAFVQTASASNKPDWVSQNFNPEIIELITVLPVVDLRRGGDTQKVNDHREMKRAIRIHVGKRRYPIERETDIGLVTHIDEAWLNDPTSERIRMLGPEGSRYLLLLVLVELETHTALQTKTVSKMTGFLFDRTSGELLWKNTGSYEWKVGLLNTGPLGALGMNIGAQGTALLQATRSVMKDLEKKPK